MVIIKDKENEYSDQTGHDIRFSIVVNIFLSIIYTFLFFYNHETKFSFIDSLFISSTSTSILVTNILQMIDNKSSYYNYRFFYYSTLKITVYLSIPFIILLIINKNISSYFIFLSKYLNYIFSVFMEFLSLIFYSSFFESIFAILVVFLYCKISKYF